MSEEFIDANVEDGTIVPIENGSSEAGVNNLQLFDDSFVTQLEGAARNAKRAENAIMATFINICHEGDWIDHDGTACLSSAGAERFLKHLPFTFDNWTMKKNSGSDGEGRWYTYICSATAFLWGRSLPCEGVYSTRDKFLGFTKAGGWKALEDINENDIRAAARHICIGNGIKQMLGLRGIKTDKLAKIIADHGGDANLIHRVTYGGGSGGGTQNKPPADKSGDADKREEITACLTEMNNGDKAAMKTQLIKLTSFKGKDGNVVSFDTTTRMSGTSLAICHKKTKEAYEAHLKVTGGNSEEMFT